MVDNAAAVTAVDMIVYVVAGCAVAAVEHVVGVSRSVELCCIVVVVAELVVVVERSLVAVLANTTFFAVQETAEKKVARGNLAVLDSACVVVVGPIGSVVRVSVVVLELCASFDLNPCFQTDSLVPSEAAV